MLNLLLMIKIVLAVTMVIGLARIAEKVGPDWAGVLSGFPLGIALVLFFYGIEQGTAYASQAAYSGLLGLACSLGFVVIYAQTSRLFHERSWFPMGLALFGFYGLASFALKLPYIAGWGALFAVVAAWIASRLLHPLLEPSFRAVNPKWWMFWGRAVLAALLVVIVTSLANWLSPEWAGMLASFPLTLFSLMLLLQLSYGTGPPMVLAKHFPYGVGSLIVYTIAVAKLYPLIGVALGTALAFALAGIYLLGFAYWRRYRHKIGRRRH
ncbi:hypothetical protein [Ferrimonas pelagia]|uniref:DUF3147 family protein n=1 Tax=Ferrimonas pelagia TaxID=1177826 RepID=A0ABP9EVU8_9GAMM